MFHPSERAGEAANGEELDRGDLPGFICRVCDEMGEAFDDRVLLLDEGDIHDEESPSESCTPVCCQGRSCAYCSCAELLMAVGAKPKGASAVLNEMPSLRRKLRQSQTVPDWV